MKGYTLIELLIAITIAGILLGYGTPSFFEFQKEQTMKAERNRLMVSIAYARTHSINKNVYVVMCPSSSGSACDNQSNWHQGWIVFEDHNRDRTFNLHDKLLEFDNLDMKGLTATSSLYRQKIRFNEMGFSPGTNTSINFCDERGSEHALSIVINNTGRPKQVRAKSSACS